MAGFPGYYPFGCVFCTLLGTCHYLIYYYYSNHHHNNFHCLHVFHIYKHHHLHYNDSYGLYDNDDYMLSVFITTTQPLPILFFVYFIMLSRKIRYLLLYYCIMSTIGWICHRECLNDYFQLLNIIWPPSLSFKKQISLLFP